MRRVTVALLLVHVTIAANGLAEAEPSLKTLLSQGLTIEEVKADDWHARATVRFENRTGKTLQGTLVRCFAIGPGGKEIGTEERSVSGETLLHPGFVGRVEVPVALNGGEVRLFSCKAKTAVLD